MIDDALMKSYILRHPNCGRREIAHALQLDVRTVTSAVGRLEKQGFIHGEASGVPGRAGRATVRYAATQEKLFFAGIFVSDRIISGTIIDDCGNQVCHLDNDSFNLRSEIPATATRKILALLRALEDKANCRTTALNVVFPEDYYRMPLSGLIVKLLQKNSIFEVYMESQLTVHGWQFFIADQKLKNLLLLHFGCHLESAYWEDGDLSPRQSEVAARFEHLPTGVHGEECVCGGTDCLWNQVSLAVINEERAAASAAGQKQQLDSREKIIVAGALAMHRLYHADRTVIVALSSDWHLRAMPSITSAVWGGASAAGDFLNIEYDNNKECAILGAKAVLFRSWSRFIL